MKYLFHVLIYLNQVVTYLNNKIKYVPMLLQKNPTQKVQLINLTPLPILQVVNVCLVIMMFLSIKNIFLNVNLKGTYVSVYLIFNFIFLMPDI